MKIHLIRKESIEKFTDGNARARSSFREFLAKLKYARWETPADMQDTFASADLLGKGSNRVVFDIGGNNYRLICQYLFGEKRVHLFICWIGTHAEYSAVCYQRMQYTINYY